MHYDILTENYIETSVEQAIDRLDRRLLANQITQEQYEKNIAHIDQWSARQYEHLKNAKGVVWSCSW